MFDNSNILRFETNIIYNSYCIHIALFRHWTHWYFLKYLTTSYKVLFFTEICKRHKFSKTRYRTGFVNWSNPPEQLKTFSFLPNMKVSVTALLRRSHFGAELKKITCSVKTNPQVVIKNIYFIVTDTMSSLPSRGMHCRLLCW